MFLNILTGVKDQTNPQASSCAGFTRKLLLTQDLQHEWIQFEVGEQNTLNIQWHCMVLYKGTVHYMVTWTSVLMLVKLIVSIQINLFTDFQL